MRSSLVRTSAAAYTVVFAFCLLVAWWQGRLAALLLPDGWASAALHLVLGVALAAAVLALGEVARRTSDWARRLDAEFSKLLAPLGVKDALILAAASGIAEETLFRGILQPAFGLYAASLAFGLLHYPMNRRMIPWTLIAIGMGFVLGVLYQSTESILAVGTAHGLINFVELCRIGSEGAGAQAERVGV